MRSGRNVISQEGHLDGVVEGQWHILGASKTMPQIFITTNTVLEQNFLLVKRLVMLCSLHTST